MKVIYIAGPYSGEDIYDVHCNIQEAERYAAMVWEMGAAALCPHKNTAYMDGVVCYDQFLAGCIEMMNRCDAVWFIQCYEKSPGAMKERAWADIPCFTMHNEVLHFIQGKK